MELFSDSLVVNEVNVVNSFKFLHLDDNLSDAVNDFVFIFWQVQVWNLTSVKHIVDVFNERFTNDLSISHDEGNLLSINSSSEHKVLHIFLELSVSVSLD
jgi:hypothetical protein